MHGYVRVLLCSCTLLKKGVCDGMWCLLCSCKLFGGRSYGVGVPVEENLGSLLPCKRDSKAWALAPQAPGVRKPRAAGARHIRSKK